MTLRLSCLTLFLLPLSFTKQNSSLPSMTASMQIQFRIHWKGTEVEQLCREWKEVARNEDGLAGAETYIRLREATTRTHSQRICLQATQPLRRLPCRRAKDERGQLSYWDPEHSPYTSQLGLSRFQD